MAEAEMRALVCEAFGPPESLKLRQVEVPEPGPGEVLIKAAVAGVNFPETLIIENKYQIKPPMPFSPGGELSGVIAKVGPGVADFTPGDRVAALTSWGAFADYVIAQAERTTHVPDAMPLDVAAAFNMAYGTSHHALKQRAELQPGENLMVLGT